MAGYAGALQKFRSSGYPEGSDKPEGEEPESVRVIKLTEEEAKDLQGSESEPGAEYTCEVTGKLEGHTLRVMSVRRSGGGEPNMEQDAAEAMAKSGMGPPPMSGAPMMG